MAYDPEGDWPTIVTLNKELGNDNKLIANSIQLLNQTNELYEDMPFAEANEGTSHVHLMDATVPRGTWRRFNEGIRAVSSSSLQVRDTCGWQENRAECDLILARRSGDVSKFRARQDRRILQGINDELNETMFYGDVRDNPLQFYGLAPRYDNLGNPSDKPAANTFGMTHVLDAGGTTASSQTSIWLVGWGVDVGAFGIYPNTAPNSGIESDDLGEVDLYDSEGKVFRGYATHHRVQQGLAIADWRYVVRIANVEVTATLDSAAITQLCHAMIDATLALPDLKMVRPIIYMNRTVMARLHKAAMDKENVMLNFSDLYGVKNQLNISNIPIKMCDALVNTEEVLTV